MHPNLLVDVISERFPGFGELKRKHQHCYAHLMMLATPPISLVHKRAGTGGVPYNSIPIQARYLDEKFGRGLFHQINSALGCLARSEHWNASKSETRAYWLTAVGRSIVEQLHERLRTEPSDLVDLNGRRIQHRQNGILTARDSHHGNAVTTAQVPWEVPVHMDAINLVLEMGVEEAVPGIDVDRAQRVTDDLRTILTYASNNNVGYGRIPQYYQEARSGRLYGANGFSLQNATREARFAALHDCHDYDFDNCHFRIMAEMARRAEIPIPTIDRYIARTRPFREDLAAAVDVSYEQIKECLLAMLNGARHCLNQSCAIVRTIGIERARALYANAAFNDLQQDSERVADWMLTQAVRQRISGGIINCRGKVCIGNSKQELAHLLQGIESQMLHAALEVYGPQVLVIQHDGFTLPDFVNTAEVEGLILRATGFEMPVRHQQLVLEGLQ